VIVENMGKLIEKNLEGVLEESIIVALVGLANLAAFSFQTRVEIHNLNILFAISDVLKS
jgi:hypothetical protein